MAEARVSTAVRRLAVVAQGYTGRYRRATRTSVEEAIRRLSCVQLDSISTVERSHPDRVDEPDRRLPGRRDLAAPRGRAHLRVLGPRGVPAPDRVLAALPARKGERRPRLVRERRQDASPPGGRGPRGDPRARASGVASLRGRGEGWNVELEAGKGDARAALEPRRPRDRGPRRLPARLRAGRAGDPAAAAGGARALRARGAAHIRGAGGPGPGACSRTRA